MDYASLGDSGVMVSRLALGLGFRGQSDEQEMERAIRRAIELGINFLDCANVYGRMDDRHNAGTSEIALGRAIASCRDEVVITSKATSPVGPSPNDRGGSRYHILRELERSLKRLKTDHIDIYFLHARDQATAMEESIGAMADLVRQGKIRYWGICNYCAWENATALAIAERLGAPRFVCVQNPYNLLNRDLERELIPFCREARRGMMTYSPLAVGLLSGAYREGEPPPAGSLWAARRADTFAKVFAGKVLDVLRAVGEIAAARGKTPAQIALNWIVSHPEVTAAITGSDTVAQVEESVGAVGWSLSTEERARLDAVSESQPLAVA